jgi:hypothetical protein
MSNGLSNVQPIERPQPLIRVQALASVAFERTDVAKMTAFLLDFGFTVEAAEIEGRRFLRGVGELPFCVELIPAARNAFVGFSFAAATAEDLRALAQAHGATVDQADTPGGGSRVRLIDPDGWRVDVVHGFELLPPLASSQGPTAVNTPFEAPRINTPVRYPTVPSPVFRMGHVVLQTLNFAAASQWYMEQFGLIASDVQVTADGVPALGFFRLDRGETPSDHHSLAILAGPGPAMLHVSTETSGLDAIGQGQQHLLGKGWTHHWGIGRHVLGSQIFDYWKDPVGDEWEHYADGDLMTSDHQTGYHPLNLGSLWAWGDDIPEGLRPPDGAAERAPPSVRALIEALQTPARPWLP